MHGQDQMSLLFSPALPLCCPQERRRTGGRALFPPLKNQLAPSAPLHNGAGPSCARGASPCGPSSQHRAVHRHIAARRCIITSRGIVTSSHRSALSHHRAAHRHIAVRRCIITSRCVGASCVASRPPSPQGQEAGELGTKPGFETVPLLCVTVSKAKKQQLFNFFSGREKGQPCSGTAGREKRCCPVPATQATL